jgi:hypothetical protein
MSLSFWGTLLNAVGSVVLVFTPLAAAYGGPVRAVKLWRWRVGWSLLILGFALQALSFFHFGG